MMMSVPVPSEAAGQELLIEVPVQSTVFSQNWKADVYYIVYFDNISLSKTLTITVNCLSQIAGPQPTNILEAPQPTTGYAYTYDEWSKGVTLGVVVTFGGIYAAQVGDMLFVSLSLLGAADTNLNRQLLISLTPYVITQADYKAGVPWVTIRFEGDTGGRHGFLSASFTHLDLYKGGLYIDVLPLSSQLPMRSFSTPMTVYTMPPPSEAVLDDSRS
jgi:hypothetical protein